MSKKYVYFLKPIGMDGPYKVGCSVIPERRLQTHDIWSPFKLELICTVPGTHSDERNVHFALKQWHRHGEWFDTNPVVLAIIDHARRIGALPPLERAPYGGGNIRKQRNAEWSRAKAQISREVRMAERHAYGHWQNEVGRPARITALMASYLGAFIEPPSQAVIEELRAYISTLRAKPKAPFGGTAWRDWFERRHDPLACPYAKAA